MLGKLAGELADVGRNVNQLAHHANAGQMPHGDDIEMALAEVRAIEAHIKAAIEEVLR